MCFVERNTVRRGRSTSPEIFLRILSLRRSRPTNFIPMTISLGLGFTGLTGLATNLLAAVADALAAIRLWGTERTDLSCELSELALVRRREREHRALGIGRDDRGH